MAKREASVKVRLNDEEDKFLSKQAEKLGVSRSEVVRRFLINAIEEDRQKEISIQSALKEAKRIGKIIRIRTAEEYRIFYDSEGKPIEPKVLLAHPTGEVTEQPLFGCEEDYICQE